MTVCDITHFLDALIFYSIRINTAKNDNLNHSHSRHRLYNAAVISLNHLITENARNLNKLSVNNESLADNIYDANLMPVMSARRNLHLIDAGDVSTYNYAERLKEIVGTPVVDECQI